jgi:hypothetical protein
MTRGSGTPPNGLYFCGRSNLGWQNTIHRSKLSEEGYPNPGPP